MEREILFRGKDCRTCEWVEGDYTRYSKAMGYITADLIENEVHEVDTRTVGQYTGLTDRNGIKIFEGDIVEDWDGMTGIVKFGRFNVDDFVCEAIGWYVERSEVKNIMDGICQLALHCWQDFDVIGNIHDNPELMEGGKDEL